MPICKQEGCNIVIQSKTGFCMKHYKQNWYLRKVGRESLMVRPNKERWVNKYNGYVMIKPDGPKGELIYEHRYLAEKALGRPLPPGAIVHHTGARDDNHGPFKLVICPDQAYHVLLHARMKELGYEDN